MNSPIVFDMVVQCLCFETHIAWATTESNGAKVSLEFLIFLPLPPRC